MTGAEARIPRAFAGAEIGDRRKRVCRRRIGAPGLQCSIFQSPELPGGAAETGSRPLRPVRVASGPSAARMTPDERRVRVGWRAYRIRRSRAAFPGPPRLSAGCGRAG